MTPVSYHLSNLLLIALKTVQLLVQIDNICLEKLISVICKWMHVENVGTWDHFIDVFRMKPVYFAVIKFNSHLLQIREVSGWELSAKSRRLLAVNYFCKKLQLYSYTTIFAKSSSCTTLLKWIVLHVCFISILYNVILKKRQSQWNKIKSTRELTVRVSSLSVFVIDFEQVLSGRSTNPD